MRRWFKIFKFHISNQTFKWFIYVILWTRVFLFSQWITIYCHHVFCSWNPLQLRLIQAGCFILLTCPIILEQFLAFWNKVFQAHFVPSLHWPWYQSFLNGSLFLLVENMSLSILKTWISSIPAQHHNVHSSFLPLHLYKSLLKYWEVWLPLSLI